MNYLEKILMEWSDSPSKNKELDKFLKHKTMKITKTNKALSQREMSKLINNKNTINLSSIERRKNTRYEKKMKALKQKVILFILVLIVLFLGAFQIKVYGEIPLEIQAGTDPLEQLLQDNPEIKEVIRPEVKKKVGFNIDKLAYAVAYHETKNCTLGYGKEYNNCFGIKYGNTVPCEKIGRNKMCIFDSKDESYEAFKTIWSRWYVGLPNLRKAERWSGHDRAREWLDNVLYIYNKDLG